MTISEKYNFLTLRFQYGDGNEINTDNNVLKSLLSKNFFEYENKRIKCKSRPRDKSEELIIYVINSDFTEKCLYVDTQPMFEKIDVIENMFKEIDRMYDEQMRLQEEEELTREQRYREFLEEKAREFQGWLENFKKIS